MYEFRHPVPKILEEHRQGLIVFIDGIDAVKKGDDVSVFMLEQGSSL